MELFESAIADSAETCRIQETNLKKHKVLEGFEEEERGEGCNTATRQNVLRYRKLKRIQKSEASRNRVAINGSIMKTR